MMAHHTIFNLHATKQEQLQTGVKLNPKVCTLLQEEDLTRSGAQLQLMLIKSWREEHLRARPRRWLHLRRTDGRSGAGKGSRCAR